MNIDIDKEIYKTKNIFNNARKGGCMKKRMSHFQQIIIQSKDDTEDFRAFCHCSDDNGCLWVLRGYGETAGQAADNAWEKYIDFQNWDIYGEQLNLT